MRSKHRLPILAAVLLLSVLLVALVAPPFAQAKETKKDLPALTCHQTITNPRVAGTLVSTSSSVSCNGTVYRMGITTTLYVGSRMLDRRTNTVYTSYGSSAAYGCYGGYAVYYAVQTGYWTDRTGYHTLNPLNSYTVALRC